MVQGWTVYRAKDVKELSPDALAPNKFGAPRDVRCGDMPLTKPFPRPDLAGMLRMSKFAPGEFVLFA